MSGGHFQYRQYEIGQIAADIEEIIISNDDETKDEYGCVKGYGFSPEVIAELKKCRLILLQAEVYVQRIDWLVSGDSGEESFLQRLADELSKIEGN